MTGQSLLLMACALGAGAILKGATGMGLPLISVPILAAFLGVPHAIAILTLPVLAANGWQVWELRRRWSSMPFMPMLLAGSLVGLLIGVSFLKVASAEVLKLLLAGMLLTYVALNLARPSFLVPTDAARKVAPVAGALAGLVQGATGISSPVLGTFVHSLRLERDGHVFAVSSVFLLFGVVQFPALVALELVGWRTLAESVLALVPVALLLPVGTFLGRRMSRRVFDRLLLALLTLIAVKLARDGSAVLLG